MRTPEQQAWTDEELAIAATLGEMSAFDELVRRYRPAVIAVARRIVPPAMAEDVAQDALLLAFKALPQLDEPARFGSWLHSVTRNRALRCAAGPASREQTGHSEIDLLVLEHARELSSPHRDLERDETLREVREAVEELPEALQVPLVLRYFERVPVARIAAFLGVPESTVKWRLREGRRRMKELLQARWREPAPAKLEEENDRERTARRYRPARSGAGEREGAPPAHAHARQHHQDGARDEPDRSALGRQGRRAEAVQRHSGARRSAAIGASGSLCAPA